MNQKMGFKKNIIRICIMSHFGYPLYNKKCKSRNFGGGAGVQLYFLSKEFSKNNNLDVNVITGNHKISKNKIELYDNIKLYNVLPLKRTLINVLKYIIFYFTILIKINPDIVIQRTANISTGLCSFYCKLFKKKFIYSIANKPDVNGDAEKGIFGKFYKYGINNATYIIAQNLDQIRELERNKQRKFSNIKVIKSCFDIKELSIKIKKDILWVSRCRPWKRPELFLKLAQQFPDEKFIMICTKTSNVKYWNSIYKEALKISNLKFIEYVPFFEINNFYKKAKVFVNTSSHEGFPNSFIQSFINKTPVLSLSIDSDDIIQNKKLGFFCHNDFNMLVYNLKILLENYELYKLYSENSYLYVKKNHDIHKIGKEWIQLIEKL